jgi:hypothetical protein
LSPRRRVLDLNDVDSAKWQSTPVAPVRSPLRWLYGLEARRLPRAEQAWIARHTT